MRRDLLLAAAVVVAALLVPIWVLEYFPGQDTPNHLYAAHILSHIADPAFSASFEVNGTATTNIAFPMLMQPLAAMLGLEGAHRILLSAYVVGFVFGAIYLAGSVERRRAPLGLLVAPFAFNWYLTSGFYNFCFTLPLFCFALGWMLRGPDLPWRRAIRLGLLGLVTAAAHPFTVVCLGAVSLVALRPWRARLRGMVALAPGAVLIAIGLLRGGSAAMGWDWPDGFPSPLYSIATSFYRFAVPLSAWQVPAAAPAYLILAAATAWSVWQRRREPLGRGVAVTGALVAMWFLLPERGFGFDHVNTRVFGFIALSVPVWALFDGWLRRPRLLLGVAAGLAVGMSGLFWIDGARLQSPIREMLGGMSSVRKRSTLAVLNFAPRPSGYVIWPLLHTWAYYGIERNTLSPGLLYAHADRPSSRLAYRKGAPLPPAPDAGLPERLASGALCETMRRVAGDTFACPAVTERALEAMARKVCAYDNVLTWEAPSSVERRLAGCMALVHRGGRLRVFSRTPLQPSGALDKLRGFGKKGTR